MLHQSRANLSRRIWRKKPHFPRQISIFVLPSTRQRSCTTAVSKGPAPLPFLLATKGKGKRKPRSAWRTASYSANARLRRTLHFVFFLMFFFPRVGKNQWARVTRNKEKTRRGLSILTMKFLNGIEKFWNAITHERDRAWYKGVTHIILYTQAKNWKTAVDMKGLSLNLLRSAAQSAEWKSGLVLGATLITKICSSEHIYNEIDKI